MGLDVDLFFFILSVSQRALALYRTLRTAGLQKSALHKHPQKLYLRALFSLVTWRQMENNTKQVQQAEGL